MYLIWTAVSTNCHSVIHCHGNPPGICRWMSLGCRHSQHARHSRGHLPCTRLCLCKQETAGSHTWSMSSFGKASRWNEWSRFNLGWYPESSWKHFLIFADYEKSSSVIDNFIFILVVCTRLLLSSYTLTDTKPWASQNPVSHQQYTDTGPLVLSASCVKRIVYWHRLLGLPCILCHTDIILTDSGSLVHPAFYVTLTLYSLTQAPWSTLHSMSH